MHALALAAQPNAREDVFLLSGEHLDPVIRAARTLCDAYSDFMEAGISHVGIMARGVAPALAYMLRACLPFRDVFASVRMLDAIGSEDGEALCSIRACV